MPNLHVVIASTRPGRAGLPIGTWFHAFARQHGKFEAKLVDLAEVNLPLLDEPKHPRLGQYEKEHTRPGARPSTSPTPSSSSRPNTTTARPRRS